jgi:hypothetical protein
MNSLEVGELSEVLKLGNDGILIELINHLPIELPEELKQTLSSFDKSKSVLCDALENFLRMKL